MTPLSKITVVFLFIFLCQQMPVADGRYDQQRYRVGYGQAFAYAQEGSQQEGRPKIEWFKKELRISPKYQERDVGIFGLSWAHFLVMVFLIVSFIIALAALIVRYHRTKELLSMLTKEENTDGKKG